MTNTDKLIAKANADTKRFQPNPRGPGFLTRAERWSEVIRYARRKDAVHAGNIRNID